MTVLEPVSAFILGLPRQRFTLEDVVAATQRPRLAVLRVLDRLAAEGYLVEISDDRISPKLGECGPPRRNPTWRIAKNRDVSHRTGPARRKNTLRDRLYRLIRARRRFTRNDLVVLSGASRGTVDDYTRILERESVIRRVGKRGRDDLWLLVKDLGPVRPRVAEEGADAARVD
ncbi:MAG: hypothetical protein P1P84_22115 [Deferrisomatales bacterium]|nr:hypothetical protein [Deferrisomatales bacterium]